MKMSTPLKIIKVDDSTIDIDRITYSKWIYVLYCIWI